MLGRSDTWQMSCLSHRPSKPDGFLVCSSLVSNLEQDLKVQYQFSTYLLHPLDCNSNRHMQNVECSLDNCSHHISGCLYSHYQCRNLLDFLDIYLWEYSMHFLHYNRYLEKKLDEMVFCCQNCSSNREKLLKFKSEGREFAKLLRSLEQFKSNSGQSEQFLVTECFFNWFLEVSHI